MLKFLLFLFFIFIFLVLAFGFSIVKFIFRLLFGGWSNNAGQQSSREQRNKTDYTGTKHNSSKVISKEEGEYVDYEEIK
ncbi:MAG: DUF4834 family protein [Dysgonamonadaceae bacterium]|jgi:hypothetical protein|nr:DUF4834 family protein [Dysgonamonadaceae bacterium]